MDPNSASARISLGMVLERRGRVAEAITQYRKAFELDPADLTARNNLAWLLATAAEASLRDGGKAVALARQANQETGEKNPVVLHTLAAAYAEAGKFPDAVEAAQHALRLAEAQSNTVLTGALQTESETVSGRQSIPQCGTIAVAACSVISSNFSGSATVPVAPVGVPPSGARGVCEIFTRAVAIPAYRK